MARRATSSMVLLLFLSVFGGAPAEATPIRIEGGITSFSGVVFGDVAPSYLWVNPGGVICDPIAGCPQLFGHQVCPDASLGGCNAFSGLATNVDLGTNRFSSTGTRVVFGTLGATPYNELTYHPSGFMDGDPDDELNLGTLTFANGLWSGDADFGFTINARVASIDHVFDGILHMDLTPNTGTPIQNADYIVLRNANGTPVVHPLTLEPLGSVRAFEGGSVTVTLWGSIGSLDPTRFSDPVGDGFLDPSITDAVTIVDQVPEPATAGLIAFGLGAFAAHRKRRRTGKA